MNIINYEYDHIVIETDERTIEIEKNLEKFLDNLCKQYGSSLKGRIDSFNYVLKTRQKTPIIVSMPNRVILFPIYSIYGNKTTLLNYYSIKKISKKRDSTVITFNNCNQINLDIDYRMIKNQIKRIDSYLNYYQNLNSDANNILNFC